MPVYEYKCSEDDAHAIMSVHRSIKDEDPGYTCVECEADMIRSYSSFAIQFKGSGFYKTDSAKNK
jgi:putative FmdB family regulatory protein